MAAGSRNLALSLIFMCVLMGFGPKLGVSGATSPESLPSVPPDIASAEIGHRPMAGVQLKSDKDQTATIDESTTTTHLRSELPSGTRFNEPRLEPSGGPHPGRFHAFGRPPQDQPIRSTTSAPPPSTQKELNESTMTSMTEGHTSLILFFVASMIVLPLTTMIVRFWKVTTPELGFGIGFHTVGFVAICGLIYSCYHLESNQRPEGTMLTTTILMSKYGWTWCSLVVASFLAGLAASRSHRFYKFLSFLSGFTGDFAFVLSCYIESMYHLTSHKINSEEAYLTITPLGDRELVLIAFLYLMLNQFLEYLAQRFDLVHRGHKKYYDEDFDEESEVGSTLKVSVGSQTSMYWYPSIPGWRLQRVEHVYNKNKYRTPWTTGSGNATVISDVPVMEARDATVIDMEGNKPEEVDELQYVAIDIDMPEEHQGQGDQEE